MNKFPILLILAVAAILIGGANFMIDGESQPRKSPADFLPERCQGRQWNHPSELSKCMNPDPPLGRWHAVYTEDFAKAHNLSPDNISTDLSPGIDYMEMDVQPYGTKGGVACLVGMLVKKPHDIALYNLRERSLIKFPQKEKLLHLIDINHHRDNLKATTTFGAVSRDYDVYNHGYLSGTYSMYAKDVLSGYDYVAADHNCRGVSMHPQYFPDKYALWVSKASTWGKYKANYTSYNDPGRPKKEAYVNSHFFINIPHELISHVFKDVPIGGE